MAVIDAIADRFRREVAEPAFAAPRGAPRLVALMELWIAWSEHPARPGGCQLIASAFDLDALEGAARERLGTWIGAWREAIRRAVADARDLDARSTLDPDDAASLAHGLYAAQHIERSVLGDATAASRALRQWCDAVGASDTDGRAGGGSALHARR